MKLPTSSRGWVGSMRRGFVSSSSKSRETGFGTARPNPADGARATLIVNVAGTRWPASVSSQMTTWPPGRTIGKSPGLPRHSRAIDECWRTVKVSAQSNEVVCGRKPGQSVATASKRFVAGPQRLRFVHKMTQLAFEADHGIVETRSMRPCHAAKHAADLAGGRQSGVHQLSRRAAREGRAAPDHVRAAERRREASTTWACCQTDARRSHLDRRGLRAPGQPACRA